MMAHHNARVQGEATNDPRGYKPPGYVAWDEHYEAWIEYHKNHSQQNAETIERRGGFGYWEITSLLGHEPQTWRKR